MPKNFIGQPFRVSLNSGIENFYASEGYVTISVEVFYLTVPKTFVVEPFCAVFQKNSGSEKSLWIRGRGKCTDSPSKISCLTVPKKFVGQPFRVSLISGIENFG